MGQLQTYQDMYLESRINDLKREVVNYKAKNNYIYGKGAFRLACTYKIYSQDLVISSIHRHLVTATARFVSDKPDVGAYAYIEAMMYDENGQPIDSTGFTYITARTTDVAPTLNQSSAYVTAMTTAQKFYMIARCYANSAGSVTVNLTYGSLEGWT